MVDNSTLLNLTGKSAIVTGGAVGIGYGISQRMAAAGAVVVIADLHEENGNRAADQLRADGFSAHAVQCDVASRESVDRMVSLAIEYCGKIDLLVNNAGIFPSVSLSDMSEDDFMQVINVNLRGVYLCTKAVAAVMIRQGEGGKIINITSIDALHPSMPGLAHYDASKHGVWGFTKNVALELAEHQIWVNAVAPGGIATPGVAALQSQAPEGVDMEAVQNAFLAKIPMHRMGEADDIGKVVLFLASEMASYMTGTQIVVDGGALLS